MPATSSDQLPSKHNRRTPVPQSTTQPQSQRQPAAQHNTATYSYSAPANRQSGENYKNMFYNAYHVPLVGADGFVQGIKLSKPAKVNCFL